MTSSTSLHERWRSGPGRRRREPAPVPSAPKMKLFALASSTTTSSAPSLRVRAPLFRLEPNAAACTCFDCLLATSHKEEARQATGNSGQQERYYCLFGMVNEHVIPLSSRLLSSLTKVKAKKSKKRF